jgi:hypothetical protein
MKKILNISVIAALAVLPFAANATPVAGDPANIATNPPTGQTAQNVTASAAPKYQLAEANNAVDGVVATAGYVKGAYNAAIKAVNKLADTKQDALSSEQLSAISNVSGLDTRVGTLETTVGNATSGLVKDVADNAAAIAGKQATLTETQLSAVNSGITAAKVTQYDGYATGKQDALTETQLGAVNSGITSTKVGQYDQLVTDSANYATKTGAAATAAAAVNGATVTYDLSGLGTTTATVTGTVPVVDTWGATQPAANPVSVTMANNTVVTGLTGNTANNTATISAPSNFTYQNGQ